MLLLLPALLIAAAPPQPPMAAPPPRAGLFISPMGEPFRAEASGGDAVELWFAGADADADGALSLAEIQRDAVRFFAALDVNADGEIDPAETGRYENEIAPEVQVGAQMRDGPAGWVDPPHRRDRRRGLEFEEGTLGAGRYAFLNIPEPVVSADLDLNRGVSRQEFLTVAGQRLAMLDRDGDGRLTRAELPPLPQRKPLKDRKRRKRDEPEPYRGATPIPLPPEG